MWSHPLSLFSNAFKIITLSHWYLRPVSGDSSYKSSRSLSENLSIHSRTRAEHMQHSTRLHSSRMRTARALTVSPSMLCTVGVPCSRGVPGPGGCLVQGVAWSMEGCLVWGVPGLGGFWSGGVWFRGVPGLGVVSQHALRQTPLVNRMTDRCKNITLPQTSFAGGNDAIVTNECPSWTLDWFFQCLLT